MPCNTRASLQLLTPDMQFHDWLPNWHLLQLPTGLPPSCCWLNQTSIQRHLQAMLCNGNGCAMCTSTPAVSKLAGLCKSVCVSLEMSSYGE